MANLPTIPNFEDVLEIPDGAPLQGGPGGIDNQPHQQLANRDQWLRQRIEEVAADIVGLALGQLPDETVTRAKLAEEVKTVLNDLTLSEEGPLFSIGDDAGSAAFWVNDKGEVHGNLVLPVNSVELGKLAWQIQSLMEDNELADADGLVWTLGGEDRQAVVSLDKWGRFRANFVLPSEVMESGDIQEIPGTAWGVVGQIEGQGQGILASIDEDGKFRANPHDTLLIPAFAEVDQPAGSVNPVLFGADKLARRESFAALNEAYAHALATDETVFIQPGRYRVNGVLSNPDPATAIVAHRDTQFRGLCNANIAFASRPTARNYKVLAPEVQHYKITQPTPELIYNHDGTGETPEFEDGRIFISAWNANPGATEGEPGQKNVYKEGVDLLDMAGAPYTQQPLTNATNPYHYEEDIIEWQPVMAWYGEGKELWCCWSTTIKDRTPPIPEPSWGYLPSCNCYVSKRSSANGPWTNYRFAFDSAGNVSLTDQVDTAPENHANLVKLEGDLWSVFVVCSSYKCHDGTYAIPVVLTRMDPDGDHGWDGGSIFGARNLAAFLYTKDGVNWNLSDTFQPPADYNQYTQWEVFLVEGPVSSLEEPVEKYAFWRYPFVGNDPDHRKGTALMRSQFTDWNDIPDSTPTGYEVTVTRGSALRLSPSRWGMLFNDTMPAQGGSALEDRLALSLWFSRNGKDFTPLLPFTYDPGKVQHYPDSWFSDGILYVIYSDGQNYRGITVSAIDFRDLEDETLYISPRKGFAKTFPGSDAVVDGDQLTITGYGSAGVETEASNWRWGTTWHLDTAPGAGDEDVRIVSMGDMLSFAELVARDVSGATHLFFRECLTDQSSFSNSVNETDLGAVADPTAEQRLVLTYSGGVLTIGGATATVVPRLFLGRGIMGNVDFSSDTPPAPKVIFQINLTGLQNQ